MPKWTHSAWTQGKFDILIIWCCYKVAQIGWLKTTEMHSLTVLGTRSLKLSCQQGHVPSETLGGVLPCLTLASGGGHRSVSYLTLWLHHSSLCPCHCMVFRLCLFVSTMHFPLLIRTSVKLSLGSS
jgi:hypothetical protein